jgi:hypothetical protein
MVYAPVGLYTVISVRTVLVLPGGPAVFRMCSQIFVMRAHTTYRRATRRWHLLVGVRWLRWQSSVSGFYFRGVTQPWQWWVAAGSLPQWRPRLPWWQPFVYRYLVITGWVRQCRR